MLDEVEEDVLTPLDVVEDDDERLLGRYRLEQLAERPRDLVGRRRSAVTEEDVERLGSDRIELESPRGVARAASGPPPPAST